MAHLPKIKRKIFWEGTAPCPEPLPVGGGHPHGTSSASNLAPLVLVPFTKS